MEMARQSAPRTAHPRQQALQLQLQMEPRFLRLNHEACFNPRTGLGNSFNRAIFEHAMDCGRSVRSETENGRAFQVAESCEPPERLARRSAVRHRQKQV